MPDHPRDDASLDGLFADVYADLRRLAHRQRQPGDGATLDTTALVHELYLQMSRSNLSFEHTRQFYAYAARAMRHLLVDRARARSREKHGGDLRRTEFRETSSGHVLVDPRMALELDQAIRQLEADDPRAARVLELHFFTGLPLERIAELLEVSSRTVLRDWQYARAFLGAQLGG
ncbi:ECF-type sigma factor [Luteimonas saliphila]|uniref:ECF-type sigma factor n=1 Tax=Luteimonas saliphila TaxID=2804919 RepID=UPI00192D5545|nr:ECF-type sigma factor [Luteimonas saliphila]